MNVFVNRSLGSNIVDFENTVQTDFSPYKFEEFLESLKDHWNFYNVSNGFYKIKWSFINFHISVQSFSTS